MKPMLWLSALALFAAGIASAGAQDSPQTRCDRGWASSDWGAVAAECGNFALAADAKAQLTLSDVPHTDSASIKSALRTSSPELLTAAVAWARAAIGAYKLKKGEAYEYAAQMAVADLKNVSVYGDPDESQRANTLLGLVQSADFVTNGVGSPLLATYP